MKLITKREKKKKNSVDFTSILCDLKMQEKWKQNKFYSRIVKYACKLLFMMTMIAICINLRNKLESFITRWRIINQIELKLQLFAGYWCSHRILNGMEWKLLINFISMYIDSDEHCLVQHSITSFFSIVLFSHWNFKFSN